MCDPLIYTMDHPIIIVSNEGFISIRKRLNDFKGEHAVKVRTMPAQPHSLKPKIIWKNESFRNRENLQYKKTADSVY